MELSDYFDEVVRIVCSNLQSGDNWVTAAALGTHLRKAHPNADWKTFGFKSLSNLLNAPELQPRLRVVATNKGAIAVQPTQLCAAPAAPHVETYNPLRKAIWEIFTLPSPPGKRFFNRLNGSVRSGLDAAPSPADEWVEVDKIGLIEQRRWAECFVGEQMIDSPFATDASALVASPSWHPHHFGHELESLDEGLMRQWNRYRSSRVSAFVKKWLSDQNLPIEWAFQTRAVHTDLQVIETNAAPIEQQHSPEETKRLILAALSLMPLDQLLDIPIPPRLMLSALSSAKAR